MEDRWPDSSGLSQGQSVQFLSQWVESQAARVSPWVSLRVVCGSVRAPCEAALSAPGYPTPSPEAAGGRLLAVCPGVQPRLPVTRRSLPPADAASRPHHSCIRSTCHAPAPDGIRGPAAPRLSDRPHAADHPRAQDQRGAHASLGPSYHGASPTTHDCADRSVSLMSLSRPLVQCYRPGLEQSSG